MRTVSKASMGERSTLALNAKHKASLRTTIPMFVVKQWNLQPGNEIEWSFEVSKEDNELVLVGRRVKQQREGKASKK
jgi:hypothetical protein